MDARETAGGFIAGIEQRLRQAPSALRLPRARVDGLRWAVPKTDKLVVPSDAVATRSFISEGIRQRRGNREYIANKYYVRLVARLAPVPKSQAKSIPPFNPFKLYANTTPLEENDRSEELQEANVRILELNGILPNEDGQELEAPEIALLVARTLDEATDAAAGEILAERAQRIADAPPPHTTDLAKTTFEHEETAEDFPGRTLPPIKLQRGDTLARVLARLGASSWQVRAMIDSARSIFPEPSVGRGFEVKATVLPSSGRSTGELVRFSLYDENGGHKVTVTRNAANEFVPSATLTNEHLPAASFFGDGDQVQDNSLYASLHHTVAKQGVPEDVISQIMRIHAYTTDFRQRVRVGDGVEFFFDMENEERGIDGSIGDLLATFVTSGGETYHFYRFQGADGTVDFYDSEGSTSRKFLTRRPVRGENVRITSGFGLRRHPLLLGQKMHYGVDWATAHGTPIMAAGDGVIEQSGAKGEYGNYIRIRHANGYKTAYAHMSRYAPGVSPGVRVRQGQIIGYVGSTGLSSGPHLHFEVLVNGVHVNPMSIQVPNDRQLTGKDHADFKREKARIDELMRRHPVSTRVMTAGF